MALHLATKSFLPNVVESFDANTRMDKVLILIPCLRCLKIYFSNASSSGFNWSSGPGWMDFLLFFSSASMGLLPKLKRSAHLVRSKADT